MKIAVNTGGGDAPGLNAVIRAVVDAARIRGWKVYGIERGYDGLLEGDGIVRLGKKRVRGITHRGGSILGAKNRGNPLRWPRPQSDGTVEYEDRSDELVEKFRAEGFDAMIAIGGDGSLGIASALAAKGLPVVGVPKTIDNDLAATQVTFGFHTAVSTATDAIDRLHSTAEAHDRVFVVELMGRNAGWIALFAGVAGTADVILIPEIPFEIDHIVAKLDERYEDGKGFAIVVVAEGAHEKGGQPFYQMNSAELPTNRLGGIADYLAEELAARTNYETRSLVLGHLQRGGGPIAYDRLLALRFGAAAVDFVEKGHFGCMVALKSPHMVPVPIEEAIAQTNTVPIDGDVVTTARALGMSFGDEAP